MKKSKLIILYLVILTSVLFSDIVAAKVKSIRVGGADHVSITQEDQKYYAARDELTGEGLGRSERYGKTTKEEIERLIKKSVTIEELKQINDALSAYSKIESWDFKLKGNVVNEQGNPLTGVTVKVTTYSPVYSSETSKIDGFFDFDLNGCTLVILDFSKEGYYRESLRFYPEDAKELAEKIIAGEQIGEQFVSAEKLLVTMTRCEQPELQAQNWDLSLEYRANGNGKVLTWSTQSPYPNYKSVENVALPQLLPENCMYMIADTDEDGKIATADGLWKTPWSWRTFLKQKYPRRVRVIMNGEGGFIPFVPEKNKPLWRQMTLAPENGYQKEIIITADNFIEAGECAAAICYIKTPTRFGRIYIFFLPTAENYKNGMYLKVFLFMQPDGSRNLNGVGGFVFV